ncbi:MAG: tetratricopeptide repeat protein, partial [Opitutales bacterium]
RGLEILIQQAYARVQATPEDINNYREISDLYQRANDVGTAIAWIQKARELPNGKTDVSLEQRENVLILEYFDQGIEQRRETVARDPQNEQRRQELQDAVNQRHTYRSEQLASLVERYPNDFAYRYQYGELLFEEGLYDEAIAQFQLAQRNPNVRLDALIYLGRSYKEKKFHDLAIQQFATVKKEIPVLNDRKKEAIYELGQCYEAKGQTAEAIEEYKEVYSADIAFRDVAAKIDAHYSSGNAGD